MNSSLLELMRLLMEKQYLSVDYFLTKFGLSKRQFFYRLDKMNSLLKDEGAEAVEVNINGELIVTAAIKQKMAYLLDLQVKVKDYIMSQKERQQYIYLMLFLNLEYLPLSDFVTYLQCGRTTVLSDLSELGRDLNQYDIQISNNRKKGYYLSGNEAQIRLYLMKRIIYLFTEDGNSRILSSMIDDFNLDDYEEARHIIKELALKHGIHFVENRLKEFIYIFIFLRERLTNSQKTVWETETKLRWQNITKLKEYAFTLELLAKFARGQEFSQYDVHYVSAWILGISCGKFSEETVDRETIANVVTNMMSRFEALSGVTYDNPQEIFLQLYSHLRPAYYRMLFKIPIANPISSVVREEYPELYSLVSETMKPLAAIFEHELPEEELAYLTMHYAVIYAGEPKKKASVKKVALIVCNNGIGSSAILFNELIALFPDIHFLYPVESSKIDTIEEMIDIIFTANQPNDILGRNIPIIKVSPVMPMKERYRVIREVNSYFGNEFYQQPNIDAIINIVRQHGMINNEQQLYTDLATHFSKSLMILPEKKASALNLIDMIKEDYIQLDIVADDAKDAIKKGYVPLLKKKAVQTSYVDCIIDSLEGSHFVITENIALPHFKPEAGAKKIALGITRLKKAVNFPDGKNSSVKYLFCLSALDNHSHLNAMSQLIALFEDAAFMALLETAESVKEIYQFIQFKQFP